MVRYKHLRTVLFSLFFASACVAALPALAKDCVKDAGGGCQRDGLTCSPSDDPSNDGKCLSVTENRVLNCICHYTKPKSVVVPKTIEPPKTTAPPKGEIVPR
jgi:hypothetical protein